LERLSGGRISAELCDGLLPDQFDDIKLSYPELGCLTNCVIRWTTTGPSFISLSTEQNGDLHIAMRGKSE
jgi:hypothetical protein